MLLWYAAQQGPFLHRGISQILQPKVERFLRLLPPKFGVISPRICRFLGLAVKPISLHPRQFPGLFLLQIWWSSRRIIERSIADSIDVLFRFRNCLWEVWSWYIDSTDVWRYLNRLKSIVYNSDRTQIRQVLRRRKALSRWARTIGGFVDTRDTVSIYKR